MISHEVILQELTQPYIRFPSLKKKKKRKQANKQRNIRIWPHHVQRKVTSESQPGLYSTFAEFWLFKCWGEKGELNQAPYSGFGCYKEPESLLTEQNFPVMYWRNIFSVTKDINSLNIPSAHDTQFCSKYNLGRLHSPWSDQPFSMAPVPKAGSESRAINKLDIHFSNASEGRTWLQLKDLRGSDVLVLVCLSKMSCTMSMMSTMTQKILLLSPALQTAGL